MATLRMNKDPNTARKRYQSGGGRIGASGSSHAILRIVFGFNVVGTPAHILLLISKNN